MTAFIGRREFITLLGGAAAAWPLAARAQQPSAMRRVGMLTNLAADDPLATARVAAFAQAMQELGWIVGRNLQIDYRWGQHDPDRLRKYAAELVALGPEVIVANADPVHHGVAAGDTHRADRVRRSGRSGRRRFRREPGAAGRQCHRIHQLRIWHGREMAGTAQGDCAARHARRLSYAIRPAPRGSASLAHVQSVAPAFGVELQAGRRTRRWRDRARARGLLARVQRRHDRDRQSRFAHFSSGRDPCTRGPARSACGLLVSATLSSTAG